MITVATSFGRSQNIYYNLFLVLITFVLLTTNNIQATACQGLHKSQFFVLEQIKIHIYKSSQVHILYFVVLFMDIRVEIHKIIIRAYKKS